MNKPSNYTIEDGRIWNIGRSTAEQLADEGMLTLGLGEALATKHKLTAKGEAFFATPPGRRFKWTEDEAEPPLKTTADYFAESERPDSPNFRPWGHYADEQELIKQGVTYP